MRIKKIQICKLVFLCLLFAFTLVFNSYGQRAKIEIFGKNIVLIDISNIDCEIEILKDGNTVPSGYIKIADGKIDVGIATIKCKERRMVNLVKEKACKLGCDAIRFFNITEFKCFVANILFLKEE